MQPPCWCVTFYKKEITSAEVAYFSEFYYHTKFQYSKLSSA